MSGQEFLDTLRTLGYPGASDLDSQTFDWMFENEAVVPFLEWFSSGLQSSNFLTANEIEEFEELKESTCILDGTQLREALHNISAIPDEDASEEKINDNITSLTEELERCQKRKDLLIQQRNMLSIHHARISDRLDKLDSVHKTAKHEHKLQIEQSHTDSTKVNNSLENLTSAVEQLSSLYNSKTQSSVPVFLSQISLEQYHKTEEKFTQELTAFTKKQFFEGLSELAGESSRYDFLEISDPDSLLVRGEQEQVNIDDCKELARLQAFYPKSESQRVSAQVEERSVAAACEFAERKLQLFRTSPYPMRVGELLPKLQEAETILSVCRREVSILSDTEVPCLIKESATAQVTKVLRGDYDLKIARQDYFTSNQDQVINQLVIQRSRNELLTMAYELEARSHRDSHRLLTAVSMQLQDLYKGLQSRQDMMCDPSLSATRHQRSTVDSRDKFLNNFHKLFQAQNGEVEKSMFLTYSQLIKDSEVLNHQVETLQTSLASANANYDNRLSSLENNLQSCESMLYSGSSTTSGLPVLTPQPILDALVQLDSLLKRLEQAVMDIIKDVENKKKVLRNDALLSTERELFVNFYNNPDRLRRVIEELNARLQAQLVE